MFSNNQKISNRQYTRLLVLNSIGISGLVLPGIMVRTVGSWGGLCILAGMLLALLYGIFFKKQLDRGENRSLSGVAAIAYMAIFFCTAVFALGLTVSIVGQYFIPQVARAIILGVLVLLGCYGSIGGIESRGRVAEIMFGLFLLGILVVFWFSMREVTLEYYDMRSGALSWKKWLIGIYLGFLSFSRIWMEEGSGRNTPVRKTILITGFLSISIFIIGLGTFGLKGMQANAWPIIGVMSSLNLSAGFIQRFDAIFVAIWLISLFVTIISMTDRLSNTFHSLVGRGKHSQYCLIVGVALFLVTVRMQDISRITSWYVTFMAVLGLPFLVLNPVWCGCGRNSGGKLGRRKR